MARILVVEDERDMQEILKHNLEGRGHDVIPALTGEQALRAAARERLDLVLLDLMLPDMPGTEVCRALRQAPATAHVPVVMLTAKGEEIDRVVGFELGADDYVVKPFSVRELMLRLDAILRRGAAAPAADTIVEFGVLGISRAAHRVFVERAEVELTSLEFRLLTTLFDRRDRVQTRGTLLSDVWGVHAEMETRTVDTHVKRLREKLGAAGAYIETVRGVGYRFVATPPGSGG